MLAVSLSASEIEPLLGESLSLAAINEANSSVVSGPTDAVDALEKRLDERSVPSRRLRTSHAFHSSTMDGMLARFGERVRDIELRSPEIPFVSNLTGRWITPDEATDPEYWVRHLRQTVRFADGVKLLLAASDPILLEVGPGNTLGSLVKRAMRGVETERDAHEGGPVVVASMRRPDEAVSDVAYLLRALGRLWLAGVSVDASSFHAGANRHRLQLPTYPFERERYWIDPGTERGNGRRRPGEGARRE